MIKECAEATWHGPATMTAKRETRELVDRC
jgi:hypothetical protein